MEPRHPARPSARQARRRLLGLQEGASDFRGPLEVTFPASASGGIIFSESASARQIQIRNVSSFPQELTLTLQAGNTGLLPLSYVVTVLDGPNTPVEKVSVPFQQGLQLGPIEAGAAFTMDFEVAQEAVTAAITSSTLTIVSDAGARVEIPVVSLRADLLPNP